MAQLTETKGILPSASSRNLLINFAISSFPVPVSPYMVTGMVGFWDNFFAVPFGLLSVIQTSKLNLCFIFAFLIDSKQFSKHSNLLNVGIQIDRSKELSLFILIYKIIF